MTPIVLVHGLPDHTGTWEKLVPLLCGLSDRICLVGLPGIGDGTALDEASSFASISELLAAKIPFREAIYVGHDFGAILGTVLARRTDTFVKKLVLINGSDGHTLRSRIETDPAQAAMSQYAQKLLVDPEGVLLRKDFAFLKSFLFREENGLSAAYQKSLVEMWSLPQVRRNIGTYYRAFLNSPHERAPIAVPTLQLWSPLDPFLGPGTQRQMQEEHPGHRVVNLATSSHWPQLSDPEPLAAEIRRFVEGA